MIFTAALLCLLIVHICRCEWQGHRRLCEDAVRFGGDWRMSSRLGYTTYKDCGDLVDEGRHYSKCKNYSTAIFVPNRCHLMHFDKSLAVLNRVLGNYSIVFMGDSLGRQQFEAATCDTVNEVSQKFSFITSHFIRQDLPCKSECQNVTYQRIQMEKENNFCKQCNVLPIGVPIAEAQQRLMEIFFKEQFPPNMRVLIINSGAWYNYHKGLIGLPEYEEMLHLLAPIVGNMVQNGRLVAWMPAPISNDDKDMANFYGWSDFDKYNKLAKFLLAPLGVLFVDNMEDILHVRKLEDPRISSDALHWCNPGIGTIPSFINQVYFHFMALAVQGKHSVR